MAQILGLITLIGLFITIAYGYICNILALVGMEPFIWTAKTAIGIGGVFVPPVGAIMGLFVW